jgi:hypothetical protein
VDADPVVNPHGIPTVEAPAATRDIAHPLLDCRKRRRVDVREP